MCGRFNSIASGKDFAETYQAEFLGHELSPNSNVAPTVGIYALLTERDQRVVKTLIWGLVPRWSKDKSWAAKMINARSETLHEKASFKNLLSKHRCVLPMLGFYEWSENPDQNSSRKKQAHYISRTDGQVMTVAGLWTTWTSQTDEVIQTCTIITTEANDTLRPVHHRMPVILERDSVDQWVSLNEVAALSLLVPAGNEIVRSELTQVGRSKAAQISQFDDDSIGRLF